MLFDDYPEYTEADWRNEMDACELWEMREKIRDAAPLEIECPRPCCDSPSNYTYIPASGMHDPLTGVAEEPEWRCHCGNQIAESDYLVNWTNKRDRIEPDAVPEEIDEKTRIPEKRIA